MGKNNKETGIPNRDNYMRMNFLYQAANMMMEIDPKLSSLASFYSHTMHTIAKRAVLKVDPDLKRTICKGCHSVLIPGKTSTLRVKGRPHRRVITTCLICGTKRKLSAHRDGYQLWSEKESAVTAIVECDASGKVHYHTNQTKDENIGQVAASQNSNRKGENGLPSRPDESAVAAVKDCDASGKEQCRTNQPKEESSGQGTTSKTSGGKEENIFPTGSVVDRTQSVSSKEAESS